MRGRIKIAKKTTFNFFFSNDETEKNQKIFFTFLSHRPKTYFSLQMKMNLILRFWCATCDDCCRAQKIMIIRILLKRLTKIIIKMSLIKLMSKFLFLAKINKHQTFIFSLIIFCFIFNFNSNTVNILYNSFPRIVDVFLNQPQNKRLLAMLSVDV